MVLHLEEGICLSGTARIHILILHCVEFPGLLLKVASKQLWHTPSQCRDGAATAQVSLSQVGTQERLSHYSFSQDRQWEALPLEGNGSPGPNLQNQQCHRVLLITAFWSGIWLWAVEGFLSFTTKVLQLRFVDSLHENCKLNQLNLLVLDMPCPSAPSLTSCKASCGKAGRNLDSKAECQTLC